MMKLPLVGLVLASTTALAAPPTTATGDKAAQLVRALKYAGVKPTTAKGFRAFDTASIHCWSSNEGTDEELGDYACTVDKLKIKDATAYLLQTALEAAGVESTDHMSQHTTDAGGLTCHVDAAKQGGERFSCRWGVAITPKKPVKEIVQPVKIEKQPKDDPLNAR